MALVVNLMRDPKKGKTVSPNDSSSFEKKSQKIILKDEGLLDAL